MEVCTEKSAGEAVPSKSAEHGDDRKVMPVEPNSTKGPGEPKNTKNNEMVNGKSATKISTTDSINQKSITSRLIPSSICKLLLVLPLITLCLKYWPQLVNSDPKVCIIGNAERPDIARAVYEQWQGQFPTAFYMWNLSTTPEECRLENPYPKRLFMIRTPNISLPFAEGSDISRKVIMKKFSCDYIFNHDDDIVFGFRSEFLRDGQPQETLPQALVRILKVYRPAVAAFPWPTRKMNPHISEIQAFYTNDEVAPLTVFDNGQVLFHKDTLDLFFPFPPHGEGGFTGRWTLGGYAIRTFTALTFREYAISINSLYYNNTINIFNFPVTPENVVYHGDTISGKFPPFNLTQLHEVDLNSIVSWTRHPYDRPVAPEYSSFLWSGKRNRADRTGFEMRLEDTVRPRPWPRRRYKSEWILERLAERFDLCHESLKGNRLISSFDPVKIRNLCHKDFSIKLTIFTKSLPSFKTLWKTILAQQWISQPLSIDIYLESAFDLSTLSDLRQITGLAQNCTLHLDTFDVSEAWLEPANNEYAIFLDDSNELPPVALRYAEEAIATYIYRDRANSTLLALPLTGLDSPNSNPNTLLERTFISSQIPSLTAATLLIPETWRRFLRYRNTIYDEPNELAKVGYAEIIAKAEMNSYTTQQLFDEFVKNKGGYFIYPNSVTETLITPVSSV